MSAAMLAVFWLSVVALGYAWVGYAVCLAVLSRLFGRAEKRMAIWPSVTLVVPVHDSEGIIWQKIDNMLALDYPRELVEIVLVDDCSSDATPGILRCAQQRDDRFRVVRLEQRLGKAGALNAGLSVATGEIVGFTDVAAMLRPDALALAVERFVDPVVGCVSSEDEVVSCGGVGGSEGIYTRIDTMIRRCESAICSATGMSGSFYLVRRELCPPFPLDVATDMFSALHCIEQGKRAVVDELSKVKLVAQPDPGREFERKVRTMVTGLRALRHFADLLDPRKGCIALFLLSHKLLRYLMPVWVLLALGASAYLARDGGLYTWLLLAQVATLGLGITQIAIHRSALMKNRDQECGGMLNRLAGMIGFICLAIAAASVGWYRYLRGDRYQTWQPTRRSAV